MKYNTIIVGGGMAGIGCARSLQERGHSFKMITEDIGGRVRTSSDGKVNYGAYYVSKDYKHVLPFLELGGKLKIRDIALHNGKDLYGFYSVRFLKHIPAFLRMRRDAKEFRKHLLIHTKLATEHPRDELIERDAYARKFYHQNAAEYFRERKLDALVDEYVKPLLWGLSFFGDCRQVTTAVFLGCVMMLFSSPRRFRMRFDKLIEHFKDDIILDSVVQVEQRDGWYNLTTKSGEWYQCKKLVLATPMHITNTLVRPQNIKTGFNASYCHLKGVPASPYNRARYNISFDKQGAIFREDDGSYIYAYTGEDRISTFFRTWTVIARGTWEPCLYFVGDSLVDVHPEPNLFLANDHNVCNMEQAYISGMYAAKMVMQSQDM